MSIRRNSLPLVGIEPTHKTAGKQEPTPKSGTDSGTPADAGALESLAAALMNLSPEDRARLAALIAGKPLTDP